MHNYVKIALNIPNPDQPGRYFAFPIQEAVYIEPCKYETPDLLCAVANINGQFHRLCKLLMVCKVIDKYFNWTFDDGHLVILGNCFTGQEESIECLWFIYSLEEKAKRSGGHIHFILGSSEIDHLTGNWRHQHPPYATAFAHIHQSTALYSANQELWQWLQTKHIMEKIGDMLFVPGGISPSINAIDSSMPMINDNARTYYLRQTDPFTHPLLQAIYHYEDSPFRYRGYFDGRANEIQVQYTLSKFMVNKIITGINQSDTITIHLKEKVINIATNHAAENSEILLIRKRILYRVDRRGNKNRLMPKFSANNKS